MSSKIYELSYSGKDVEQAIDKINNFDPSVVDGSIIELESSEANPYNLDFLRSQGIFRVAYVYALTCPGGVEYCSPVFVYVTKKRGPTAPTGLLIQSLYAGDTTYNRSSTDMGITWTNWESKDGLDKAVEITAADVDAIWAAIMNGTYPQEMSAEAFLASITKDDISDAPGASTFKRISC